jgi:hypothetical protein
MKSTSQFHLGFERKIGYSFVGLLAGNLVSLILLLLVALVLHTNSFEHIRKVWSLGIGQAFVWSVVIWIYSMPAWVVLGLPFVLLLPAGTATRIYWPMTVPIGAALGAFAMLLISFVMNGGHLNIDFPLDPGVYLPFCLAAFIAGVAFAIYCKLVKMAMRGPTRKSGAPSGTPQFFSIF